MLLGVLGFVVRGPLLSRDMNPKGFIQASGIAGYREAADPDATLLDESSALQ